MLLRFIALHGCPRTDDDWVRYHAWKKAQEGLPECRMTEVEGEPDDTVCKTCGGKPGCPKSGRRA